MVESKKSSKKKRKKEQKNSLYGAFVKSATLQHGEMIKEEEEKDEKKNDSEDEEEEKVPEALSKLTDEELFEACGGMTAHK